LQNIKIGIFFINNQVSIYPFPANDILNVKLPKGSKNIMIEKIDLTGWIKKSGIINNGELIGKISTG